MENPKIIVETFSLKIGLEQKLNVMNIGRHREFYMSMKTTRSVWTFMSISNILKF